MAHSLDQRLVGIEQFHVLADHGDGDFVLGVELGIDHTVPLGQIGRAALQVETLNDDIVHTLGVHDRWNAIDSVDILQTDHRPLLNVGEQGDLAPRGLVDRVVGTAYQHIRLHADGAQFLDRVLGRFGLGFAGGGNVRHQGQVHEHGALGTHFHTQLARRFKERLRFDIAHGAANLDHGYVSTGSALDDAPLDFIGDVRNHLNGRAQIVTTALLAQHVFVHAASGEVVVLGHGGADEPLVVAQVKVGFSAVLGDEYFTMLERAHGARINVDVGVQLEHGDLQATRLQDGRQGSRGNALPQ